jgi:hypothetical protein
LGARAELPASCEDERDCYRCGIAGLTAAYILIAGGFGVTGVTVVEKLPHVGGCRNDAFDFACERVQASKYKYFSPGRPFPNRTPATTGQVDKTFFNTG